jgi:hypothetical protein
LSSAAQGLRSPMLSQLLTELERIEPRTRVVVAGLPEAKFRESRPDGGWSIAQVFEHLCRTNLAYLDGPLPAAIERARARGPVERPWRPSLIGGWLTGMLVEGGKPVPSPRLFRVEGPVRPQVVDEFLATVRRTRERMFEADGLDLRVGLVSPASPLFHMNLGDTFRILVVHSHRHLAQAERTRRAVGR